MSARTGPDERRLPRVQPFVVACRMVLPNRRVLTGYVTDLSSRGAQVVCDGPPPATGIVVALQIRPRRGPVWPGFKAEVKWTRPPAKPGGQPTCGVRFVQLAKEGQALLDAALDDFRRRAAELGKEPQ